MTYETHNLRAVSAERGDSVIIYHATGIGELFNISVEKYVGKRLVECSFVKGVRGSLQEIDSLMLEFSMGGLEPCHLRDVVNDMYS